MYRVWAAVGAAVVVMLAVWPPAPVVARRMPAVADASTEWTFSTLAGTSGVGLVDGTASNARFISPQAVASDSLGNVYVVDISAYSIRKITPTGVVTTYAGSTSQPGCSHTIRKITGIARRGRYSGAFPCAERHPHRHRLERQPSHRRHVQSRDSQDDAGERVLVDITTVGGQQ